jgi:hypothetical protein
MLIKRNTIIIPLLLTCSLLACGQIGNHQHYESSTMTYETITHPTAKAAIEAWQKGNLNLWQSFFVSSPQLLDDGHSRNFLKFSNEAIGKERFTSIDKVEDHGLSIYGHFHSDTWGDFKTYFKFHLDAQGKISKLEIGQADY